MSYLYYEKVKRIILCLSRNKIVLNPCNYHDCEYCFLVSLTANEPAPSKPVEEPPTNPPEPEDSTSASSPVKFPLPSPTGSISSSSDSSKPNLPSPVQNVPTSPENVQPTPVVNEPSPPEFPEPSDTSVAPGEYMPKPSTEDTSYLNDDMLTQLDMNTESIDTLIARVSSLETKEKELESAMGTISEGLERIEKKLGKIGLY